MKCVVHGTHQIIKIIQVLALQWHNNKYINKKYQINTMPTTAEARRPLTQ
jgi:hypothetical protein